MHRSSILWILCAATASSCVVTTKKEPVVHRSEPPPEEEPPPPVVRDHRTPRPEPRPEPEPPPPVVRDHRTRPEPRPRPEPPPRHEPRPSWDSRGWTLLGEKWVSGKNDFIPVGERQGRFTHLMMVVEEGDLELTYLIVEYDNGRKHSPKVQHKFNEGSRTRPIDLRGDEARAIKRIELRYANVGAGRRAKVQIWGREG